MSSQKSGYTAQAFLLPPAYLSIVGMLCFSIFFFFLRLILLERAVEGWRQLDGLSPALRPKWWLLLELAELEARGQKLLSGHLLWVEGCKYSGSVVLPS